MYKSVFPGRSVEHGKENVKSPPAACEHSRMQQPRSFITKSYLPRVLFIHGITRKLLF